MVRGQHEGVLSDRWEVVQRGEGWGWRRVRGEEGGGFSV